MRFYTFVAYFENTDGLKKIESGLVYSPSEDDARGFIQETYLNRWLLIGYSLKLFGVQDQSEFIASKLPR